MRKLRMPPPQLSIVASKRSVRIVAVRRGGRGAGRGPAR
jgi:hypothetical protein